MTEEMRNYILNLPKIQEIIEKYKPLLIYLGGSRATCCNNENSDWDIIVYTDEVKITVFDNVYIPNDKNLHMHALIYNPTFILKNIFYSLDSCWNIYMYIGFATDCITAMQIIYEKPDDPLIHFLLNNHVQICKYGVYEILNTLQDETRVALLETKLSLSRKVYYHMLLAYDVLTNSNSKALIRKIRQNYSTVTEEEMTELKYKIKYIKDFYDNLDDAEFDDLRFQARCLLDAYSN